MRLGYAEPKPVMGTVERTSVETHLPGSLNKDLDGNLYIKQHRKVKISSEIQRADYASATEKNEKF